ncbi:MAG: hypothetical protein KDD89_01080, partial [Anaerolineales bacterium]|nr:hypothetical protein [Anaerolineales bacterium]
TLRLEVANLAGVALPATAQTRLLAPDGTPQFSADLPLTILAGAPRTYELTSLDTSGWAEGVYTITVNLLDEQNNPLPEGSGYGYLSVGQALGASHAVLPQVVAPGTVTVTTVISTEVLAGVVQPNTAVSPLWPPTGLRPVITAPVTVPDPHLDWFTTVTATETVEADTLEAVTDTLEAVTDTLDPAQPHDHHRHDYRAL